VNRHRDRDQLGYRTRYTRFSRARRDPDSADHLSIAISFDMIYRANARFHVERCGLPAERVILQHLSRSEGARRRCSAEGTLRLSII
jgi:hypothetical protein